jgi:hypothetical protein
MHQCMSHWSIPPNVQVNGNLTESSIETANIQKSLEVGHTRNNHNHCVIAPVGSKQFAIHLFCWER